MRLGTLVCTCEIAASSSIHRQVLLDETAPTQQGSSQLGRDDVVAGDAVVNRRLHADTQKGQINGNETRLGLFLVDTKTGDRAFDERRQFADRAAIGVFCDLNRCDNFFQPVQLRGPACE